MPEGRYRIVGGARRGIIGSLQPVAKILEEKPDCSLHNFPLHPDIKSFKLSFIFAPILYPVSGALMSHFLSCAGIHGLVSGIERPEALKNLMVHVAVRIVFRLILCCVSTFGTQLDEPVSPAQATVRMQSPVTA